MNTGKRGFIVLLIGLWLLAACAAPTPDVAPQATATTALPTPTAVAAVATVAATAAMEALEPTPAEAVATEEPPPASLPIALTVLYTNDEHGWMLGEEDGRGAANLLGLWREDHGYGDDEHVLVLSGGDNWTGPAISTWFDGESMVEVMNAMGYDASIIGNHEFDFGLDKLRERTEQADFPYLSANLRYKATGAVPTDLGIQPYTLIDLGDLQVGLIGLATTQTPQTTDPANIVDFEFIDYETALREFVPEMREAGADLIFAPGHLCSPDLGALSGIARELGVQLLGGGHCNELIAREADGLVTLVGGSHLASYAYATFTYDSATAEVAVVEVDVRANEGGREDETVAGVVARWQAEADITLNEIIGYLAEELPRRSNAIDALIVESWLAGYPNADIALTNRGGIRAPIPAGDVTLADVIGVMPFDNVLIEVKLTGAQLEQALAGRWDDTPAGGMHLAGEGVWVLDAGGELLDPAAEYSVLINSFMYAGGDGYTFAQFDPDAYNTGIDWRQPVIDWIIAQDSSAVNPLDAAVAGLRD